MAIDLVLDGASSVMLGELATTPRAAIVVEDRRADVFCENRPLAQEWACRFLGAAAAYAHEEAYEI